MHVEWWDVCMCLGREGVLPGSLHQAGNQTGRRGVVVTVGSLCLSPVVICHFLDLDNYLISQPFTYFQVCRHRMVDAGG